MSNILWLFSHLEIFEITPLAGCLKVMGRASAAMRICLLVLTGDNNNKNWVFVAGLYEKKHNSPTVKIGLKGCLSFRRLSNYYSHWLNTFGSASKICWTQALAQSLITRLQQTRAPVPRAGPAPDAGPRSAAVPAAASGPTVPKPAVIDKMTLPLPERVTWTGDGEIVYV